MSRASQPLVLDSPSISQQPMITVSDHRGYFTYTSLFSAPDTLTRDITTGIGVLPPATGKLCEHHHPQTEVYYILAGRGVVALDGNETAVAPGSAVFIPGGTRHGIWNSSEGEELRWLYCFPTDGFGDVAYTYMGQDKEGANGQGEGVKGEREGA